MGTPLESAVRYEIDGEDHISTVDARWLQFARENDATFLTTENVVGRPIWDFITGAETRHLYGVLFDRVRARGDTIDVPFRCDSPALRRHMELAMSIASGDGIVLEGRILRLEERAHVSLLDPTARRSADFLRMCSWCKRIEIEGGAWTEAEAAVDHYRLFDSKELPRLTHGLCEDCGESVLQEGSWE